MDAYSTKMRELVLDAYDQGLKTKAVAKRFKVSRSWARRVKLRNRLQIQSPIQQKHGPDPKLTEAHRQELAELVNATPDATVKLLQERLNQPVSVSTICRALTDLKLVLKKSRSTPASGIGPT
jgi:transposase